MSRPMTLKIADIVALLEAMPPKQLEEAKKLAFEGTAHMRWVPNLGPQSNAYNCDAYEVLYGGQAGGGKTDLLIGRAIQRHQRSLILRRLNSEVQYLIDRAEEIIGTHDGFDGKHSRWYLPDNRLIIFGGCQYSGDERKFKGEPKDFIGIDEASEFPESVVDFVKQWIRTTDPHQKTQLLLSTNPPDKAEGEWLINWFGPWVDPDHELYPTPDGKLLYFERRTNPSTGQAEFHWSEEPFEITLHNGKKQRALSRTFIRSTLEDNPDLDATDYAARLAQAPEEMRARYERGEFVSEPVDGEFQVIRTAHVLLAQERWRKLDRERPGPPPGVAMTCAGVDIAVSLDRSVMSPRYGEWFAPQIVVPGKKTAEGRDAALWMLENLKDQAQINIDLGGGYGSSAFEFIKNNDYCPILGIVSGEGAMGKSVCGKFRFRNKRAEMYWRLREALDPMSGFSLSLPPDPELRAELCAVHFTIKGNAMSTSGAVITLEEKSEVKKNLSGRSPDKADALVLAWYTGHHRMRILAKKLSGNADAAHRMQTRTNEGRRPSRYDRHVNRRDDRGGYGSGEQG